MRSLTPVSLWILLWGAVCSPVWGEELEEEPSPPSKAPAPSLAGGWQGPWGAFHLGSYGRISADWDLRGGSGDPANVVAHGSRLEQVPYAEVDLSWSRSASPEPQRPGPRMKAVFTLGFNETLFHFSGDWASGIAIRNLYAEAEGFFDGRLRVWAGSRMLRGDDIYLLDYWPLDNLNTVGGGAGLTVQGFDFAAHVGVNRLADDWQIQEITVVEEGETGTQEVVVLDRQRTVVSLQARYQRLPGEGRKVGWKAKIYGEAHGIPEGEYTDPASGREEFLPQDSGFALGAQGGVWGFGKNGFINVFGRFSRGLAAYGDLAIPYGLDTDKTASRAVEAVGGFSGNLEVGHFGLLLGGYLRFFRDADPNVYDLDDRFEWILALRPHLFVGRYYRQAFEVSLQQLIPHGLDPETDLQEPQTVVKLSALPSLALSPESLSRPEFRLVYTASFLNGGALLQYDDSDPRRAQSVQHYLGIGVEWWMGESSYR